MASEIWNSDRALSSRGKANLRRVKTMPQRNAAPVAEAHARAALQLPLTMRASSRPSLTNSRARTRQIGSHTSPAESSPARDSVCGCPARSVRLPETDQRPSLRRARGLPVGLRPLARDAKSFEESPGAAADK